VRSHQIVTESQPRFTNDGCRDLIRGLNKVELYQL
jgi:hypothetical protein